MSGVVFWGSCLTTAFLAFLPSSIISTDRPVHLAILTLCCLSIALAIIASKSQLGSHNSHDNVEYIALQREQKSQANTTGRTPRKRFLYLILVVAVLALTARIDLQRRLFLASECATRSRQVWLPFLISIYDALRWQKPGLSRREEDEEEEDDFDTSAYQDLVKSTKLKILSSRWRFAPTTFLLSFGCYMVAGLWLSSESSHICPQMSSDRVTVPRLQWLVLLLDTVIAIAALELALEARTPSKSMLSIPYVWSTVAIACIAVWSAVLTMLVRTQPENRSWIFLQDEPAPGRAIFVLFYQALFLSILVASSLYSVSLQSNLSASLI